MPADSKGRKVPGYQRHVFICGHERIKGSSRGSCGGKDSIEVMRRLKMMSKQAGLTDVRVQKAGCLDFCENGISCVVYPEATWYTLDGSKEQLTRLLESHLKKGEVIEELLMDLE